MLCESWLGLGGNHVVAFDVATVAIYVVPCCYLCCDPHGNVIGAGTLLLDIECDAIRA